MKKIFVIAAMASLMLASCTKTDTNQIVSGAKGGEVTFGAFTSSVLKGWMPTSGFAESGEDRTFMASGFSINGADSVDFFVGKKFKNGTSQAGTSGVWVADPAIYYPLGSKEDYGFLAYSDSDCVKNVKWESARAVVLQVDTVQLKHDLVASSFKGKNNSVKIDGDNKVTAKFSHTQAWVNVTLNAADATSEAANVKVDTLIWKDVYNIGELTLKYNETTAADGTNKPFINWNFFGLCKCDKLALFNGYFDESTGEFTPNARPTSGYGVALTQSSNFKFEGLYPANQKPSGIQILYTINGVQMMADWSLSSISTVWAPGKKYTYNIKIGMYEVTITPSMDGSAWDPVTISPDQVVK